MNIVILNDSAYIRGGADRVAFDSARGLARAGHRVTVFTAFGPVGPELSQLEDVSTVCLGGTWIRESRRPQDMLSGIWNRSAARALHGVLAGLDPADTVVHTHLYSSALSAAVMDTALRAGFATVLSLHDYFITCPNGAYFVFPEAEICERRALSPSCLACNCDSRARVHKAWRVVRTWMQNRMASLPERLTAFAAVSQACATLARRDLPASAVIEVIPNVVAVERAAPVEVARNEAFVFTGRFESYKGPQLLAEAASKLGLKAVFCGAGPMEAELRRLCPHAVFTGWLSPAQVLIELSRARAFVFPSVYRETFGLSAAEALARGIPVVASRGTAAEEFVYHGANGLLFTHNSAADLAGQLATLADDATVARLGREAYRRYWDQPLTEDAHLQRLGEFYRSALEARPAARG